MLRREMLEGRIKDGEELTQVIVAKQLGTSRMPVREAFTQLEYEGLLERLNNRHTRAVGINRSVLCNHLRMLSAMEAEVFKLLVEINTDISILEDLLNQYAHVVECGEVFKCLELEGQFHKTLFRLTGDKHLFLIYHTTFEPLYKYVISNQSFNYESRLSTLQEVVRAVKTKNIQEIGQAVCMYFYTINETL